MKLVIDIPEEMHEQIKDGYVPLGISKYLKNGTPYEPRPHGKWEYLKEHITELRDANGYATQYGTCQFILNLMGVIEKEGEKE